LGLGALLLLPACAGLLPNGLHWPDSTAQADANVRLAAQQERTAHLEREVARLRADLRQAEEAMVAIESGLRADLRQAEEAMVAIESGLRGFRTRADAVSSLAEGRIAVERASQSVPWRPAEVREAHAKLEEAERQLEAGHSGSAVFFASRARRIAETLSEEADQVARHASTRFVRARRVNVRAGPSTDAQVIGVLSKPTPVFLERREGDWVLVRTTAGPVGWMHGSLLSPR
jgi:prefoldin subunit 5